jgi:hypothetical protein
MLSTINDQFSGNEAGYTIHTYVMFFFNIITISPLSWQWYNPRLKNIASDILANLAGPNDTCSYNFGRNVIV